MKKLLAKVFNKLRNPDSLVAALLRRHRLSQACTHPELQAFWREQGREWMDLEATEAELNLIDALARDTSGLSQRARRLRVVSAFRAAWTESFLQTGDGISWDMMQEYLPEEAFDSFLRGALDARHQRSEARR
ncbi:hypothetical protein [Hyphomonas sp.]|uniref:hypothetical protein n=1 Tax=Hyphomonas sp. TaxID=87 RepID=UPI0025C244ED|nr:hypothetical protein [Hyphomonas sp.]